MKLDRSLIQKLAGAKNKLTVPTLFTLLRILLVPVIVYAMITHAWGVAFFCFVIAAATDVIDGFLARLCDNQSLLGACLDPVADKFLLLSCFFTLAFIQTPLFTLPGWFFAIVLTKEVIILGGSLILLLSHCGFAVRPTILGKATTVVQVCFIIWLFACYFFSWMPVKTYVSMLAIMLCFVLLSAAQYIHIGLQYFLSAKECT